jgi:putative flippase GtrA
MYQPSSDSSAEIKTFSKAQASAVFATLVDFGTLMIWVEVLSGFYPIGVALGATLGALSNFFLNRHWSFQTAAHPMKSQMMRYFIVFLGSVVLNTGGVWAVTEGFHLHYFASKIAVALAVGFLYNYPLQRYFVFKKEQTYP